MENDKGHLVNIEKVEYNTNQHVDTAEILSLMQIIKMQNHKILSALKDNEQDEELKTEIMRKLDKAIADIKSTI